MRRNLILSSTTLIILLFASVHVKAEPIINPENGHYYEAIAVPGGITWHDADDAARSLNYIGAQGHLATITSKAENDFIIDNLGGPVVLNAFWLGGFQPPGSQEPSGGWKWVTGEAWFYTSWSPGEPNNTYGCDFGRPPKGPACGSSEEGLHFWANQGYWNDMALGGFIPGYIVEYPVFTDVPPGYWAKDYIYAIFNAGITTGCSKKPLKYCPRRDVNRAQMAIFIERGINDGNYTPPPAKGIFADVPVDFWAADWIEQLYKDGITTGCDKNPLRYCPDRAVNRAQMAVFLLRSKYDSNYKPPKAAGIFDDVPVTYWAADWIEQLYKEGVTTGCSTNPLKYCPLKAVNRAQMAVFLARVFLDME